MTDLYMPRNAAEVKGQLLRDLRLAAIDAGFTEPPTGPGSDWDYLAEAVANVSLLGFANVAAAADDFDELSATGQALEDRRKGLGLPEIGATGASGKIVLTVAGNCTLNADTQFIYPNGLRGRVTATTVNPSDGQEVDAVAIDTGARTNLAGGQVVRFVSPPVNLATEAKVSVSSPLTGGTDGESDERKRDRILNVRRNKPAGGNWSHVRQVALDSLGIVQDCYVYPALGGPSSSKVVPIKDLNPAIGDFTRALSSAALATVRAAIQAELPTADDTVVEAVADQACSATVLLDLPSSSLSVGTGLGWTDPTPWPSLVVADSNVVTVTDVGAANDWIEVSANTTTAPVAGMTHVAWWSSVDRLFYTALVTAVGGSTGAWELTLDRPLIGKTGVGPVVGDYVSPGAANLEKYGAAWVDVFRGMGPGENTTDVNRLPRAKRHPYITDEDPCALTSAVLAGLARGFPEIVDYQFGARSPSTPTVPAAVTTAPNVLVPSSFAVYPLT